MYSVTSLLQPLYLTYLTYQKKNNAATLKKFLVLVLQFMLMNLGTTLSSSCSPDIRGGGGGELALMRVQFG